MANVVLEFSQNINILCKVYFTIYTPPSEYNKRVNVTSEVKFQPTHIFNLLYAQIIYILPRAPLHLHHKSTNPPHTPPLPPSLLGP